MGYASYNLRRAFFGLLLPVCLLATSSVSAQTIDEQRKLYQDAKSALQDGKLTAYRSISQNLTDYPLYPYLLYDYLRPRLSSVREEEIIDFLEQYGDVPTAADIRQAWLKLLVQRGRWQTFLDHYAAQQDVSLQCYQQLARIKTKNTEGLLEDTKSIWLAGKSLPDICNAAFEVLYKSDEMTPELVWQRIRLAMHNNQPRLATWLGQRLDAEDQQWIARWVATWQNPAKLTSKPGYDDVPMAREILADGIKRLAKADLPAAISRWDTLKTSYSFDQEQVPDIERALAIRAVIKKHPRSSEFLGAIDNSKVDEELFHWRLRDALTKRDWPILVKWTDGEPTGENYRLRWLYWRARALEQTGQAEPAREIYRILANERDYYGFMAADRIAAPYNLSHIQVPEDPETWQTLVELGGVKRAHEFYQLGNKYPARREWSHVVKDMTPYQMQVAAAIASNWGWHDRTIITLGQAKAYDDLILRFPIVYEDNLKKYADRRELDVSWVLALTRAESAFMSDAKSSSGALGLMQLMPATAKDTAKAIGLGGFNNNHLLEPDKNITLGTAYLKQMHDRFGNKLMATAAYNAGPNAVAKWLPEGGCLEPDIWVESIPFNETRRYVANIMFYSTVYEWRLNTESTRMSEKMQAGGQDGGACPPVNVSQL